MNMTASVAGLPTELFTFASLGTFTGLTGATVAVTNAAARALNWSPAWFGFVIALVLCEGLTLIGGEARAPELLLAALNACLVYLSAGGASAAGASVTGGNPLPPPGTAKRGFWNRWF